MDNVKIFITGAAGVGKTTLARRIAKRMGIPFVSTSAKDGVWPKYGIKRYSEAHRLCVHDQFQAISYHREIFHKRLASLEGRISWVTDRSPIDTLAYTMLQASHHDIDDEIINGMIDEFKEALGKSNLIIYLYLTPEVILENDGYRVLNKLHQSTVDALVYRALEILDSPRTLPLVKLPAFADPVIDEFIVKLPQIFASQIRR